MSDIQAGDVVVCVDDSPCRTPGCGLPSKYRRGRAYRVERTDICRAGTLGIVLRGVDPWPHVAESARRFRKIDKADEAFIEQVRACRPIRQREPA